MPVTVTTPDYNPITHQDGDGVEVIDGLLYVTKADDSTVAVYVRWHSATIETAKVGA